jgi:salicylate hydroxylase
VTANGVLIAGAGIGGLTAALALGRRGIGVTLIEQAEKLEEAGAGIQLSPNATRVLLGLGLADRLRPAIVEPVALRLRSGFSGRDIATMPLGAATPARYGAPYWVIHRADLQKALVAAIAVEPQITLTLGATVDNFAIDPAGVRAGVSFQAFDSPGRRMDYRGAALIGADGLWSRLRALLGDGTTPRFAGRCAFRAIIPAAHLSPRDREPVVNLWIGPDGHLVHYPLRAGAAVNIVAVCRDGWESAAWNTGAGREEVLARFPAAAWAAAARQLLEGPERWQKWALYDRGPSAAWGRGPVSLLGDAAHPMLPFLAQGAAMAIEDAAVLARELARSPADYPAALRSYESERRHRTARVQREARHSDFRYHLRQPAAFIRNAMLRALGGERLLARYGWIYRWRP